MTKEEKINTVSKLVDQFKNCNSYYFTDTSFFTVEEINKFRRLCNKNGLEYKVAKNTLIRKALETLSIDYSPLKSSFKNPTGILFSKSIDNLPAKTLLEFIKKGKEPIYKGAIINFDSYNTKTTLEELSKFKSKNDLIGEIINLLQSPARNVIAALQSSGNKVSGILTTLSERK